MTDLKYSYSFLKITYKCDLKEKSLLHYNKRIVKKSFQLWHGHFKETKQEFTNEHKAIQHDFKRLCAPCLHSWMSYLNECKIQNEKCLKANAYYERRWLAKCVTTWRSQTKEFKKQNQSVEIKYKLAVKENARHLFNRWRLSTQQSKHDKENEQLANTFYLKHLMLKIVHEWQSYAEYRSGKRSLLQQSILNVNKMKLKLMFSKWKQKARESMSEQSRLHLAERFHAKNIQKWLFNEWKRKYIPQSRLMKTKQKQANWFLEMRLKTEFYFKWSLKYDEEQRLRNKNMQSLLFWSINVQKTHLAAWIGWFKMNKQKKNRYKLALEMRNQDILRECARKFIQYSTDSKERRLIANKMVKEKHSVYCLDLASKYFSMWLSKCSFQKSKRAMIKIDVLPLSSLKKVNREFLHVTKREDQSHPPAASHFLSPTQQRPAPRKPDFLLNEEVTKEPCLVVTNDPPVVIKNEPVVQSPSKMEPIILMPPTAFVQPKVKAVLSPNPDKPAPIVDQELIQFKKRLENYSNKSEKLK